MANYEENSACEDNFSFLEDKVEQKQYNSDERVSLPSLFYILCLQKQKDTCSFEYWLFFVIIIYKIKI